MFSLNIYIGNVITLFLIIHISGYNTVCIRCRMSVFWNNSRTLPVVVVFSFFLYFYKLLYVCVPFTVLLLKFRAITTTTVYIGAFVLHFLRITVYNRYRQIWYCSIFFKNDDSMLKSLVELDPIFVLFFRNFIQSLRKIQAYSVQKRWAVVSVSRNKTTSIFSFVISIIGC